MSADAPYRAERGRLLFGGEELLVGDPMLVALFAGVLNAADPADARIAPTLRQLFTLVPDYSFGPGARLLSDGTPMVHVGRRSAS